MLREFPDSTHRAAKVMVNPTGRFEIGGPKADTGLTGRKIIVDTYGGYGAARRRRFSGKDPTKVDRSAAYMARYVAKNVVASGLADRCQLQVAYAIGTAHPVSMMLDTFGTEQVDPDASSRRPSARCSTSGRPRSSAISICARPIYRETAAYGHFGRKEFPWEATDRVDDLRRAVG